MPRSGTNFLVSFGKACSMGMDKFLFCSTGNLGKTDLLSVGEVGAEWGLGGGKGKGFRTMTGMLGDVEGVANGVFETDGGLREFSPL